MAIVDDFEQVAALLRGQRRQSSYEKFDTGEALEEAYIPSIAACQRKRRPATGSAAKERERAGSLRVRLDPTRCSEVH